MENAQTTYAGFWMRFLAYIIDGALIWIADLIILVPFFGLLGITAAVSGGHPDMDAEGSGFMAAMMGTMFVSVLAVIIAGWLYFALMESSSKGATLGKLALGLRVTDLAGNRITFGRATGRYFGKIVSGMILMIGYIMAGFTQQKQALHDIMAGCLVVRK
jgi:uncharacterized RDD family membrane protein YckC